LTIILQRPEAALSPIVVLHLPQLKAQPWCAWTASGLRAPASTASRMPESLMRLQMQMIMVLN